MPISNPSVPDQQLRDSLNEILELKRASLKWYWRLIAAIVTISTVVSAVFQVISYYK